MLIERDGWSGRGQVPISDHGALICVFAEADGKLSPLLSSFPLFRSLQITLLPENCSFIPGALERR